MRLEAEAREKQRLEAFARIKALPPAPREQLEIVAGQIVAGGVVVRLVRDEPEDGEEPDENAPKAPRAVVSEDSFDRVLFGSTGDAESGRAYMESILKQKIEELGQVRRLTTAQWKRLLMAGRGDIKRLFDRIEEERKEFTLLRTDADRCVDFLRELQPLRLAIRQGPFELGSIYAKTLRKMLDEGELARRVPAPDAPTPAR
jgi:hypothetical protein